MQNPYNKYQSQASTPVKKTKAKKPKAKRGVKIRAKAKPKKSQEKTPWALIALCVFGLSASLYVFAYTDEVIDLVSRVQFGFNSVQAAAGEKVAGKEEKKTPKKKALPAGSVSGLKFSDEALTMKNASVFNALKDKRRELEKKERRLARLEEDLQKQQVEIEKQLKELKEMRRNISSKLDKRVVADQESVEKLVGVYSNMKPQNAAKIIAQLDEQLAIKVLSKMKKQNAAEILNYIEPAKAQTLSEKYAGLKR